ncbi:MbtH family NRPS accessory protein [Piscinibacter sp.]|uniref:MbtH family NRPS accessory protein n=1 Tax=Piscinibacter sp. TaxID=1903157 RepID=UPI0039E65053
MSSPKHAVLHQIVVNDAREFAVWPSARPLPSGWRPAGRTGTREELLTHLRSAFAPLVDLPARAQVRAPRAGLSGSPGGSRTTR